MTTVTEESRLGKIIGNEGAPLSLRFRALFGLRNIHTEESVHAIASAFSSDSVLLKHELAYVLGQMRHPAALPLLERILEDTEENEVVRHEAGEAIANFNDLSMLPLLRKHAGDKRLPVSETCAVALEKLEEMGGTELEASPYGSHDPSPAEAEKEMSALERQYLDESRSIYQRYKALFALRNIGTKEAVDCIAKGFYGEGRSALFEHEVAFVYGQMGHPDSVEHLATVLADTLRHEMVRHECAEALGSVGTSEALAVLTRFVNDGSRIVRESVEVALDIHAHKNSAEPEYCV